MKGDKVFCIVVRAADAADDDDYALFVKPEGDKYFDTSLLDLIHEEIFERLEETARDGATEIVMVEDGEREDVFWHPYMTTLSVKIIEPDVEEEPHPRERVTREMALDAGDPSLEGQPV